METKSVNSNVFYGILIVSASLIISWVIPISIAYKPDIFLISEILLGVLLKRFDVFIFFAILQVVLINTLHFYHMRFSIYFL